MSSSRRSFGGNIMYLMVAAAGITGTFYFGYRKLLGPYLWRRKLDEAEAYADFILEAEKRRENETVNT